MNGVICGELQKRYSRPLEHAPEIKHFGQLIAWQLFYLSHALGERSVKPFHDICRVFYGVWAGNRREIKRAGADCVKKTLFTGCDVPRQFQSRLGNRIRAVIAFIERHSLDYTFRGVMLFLQHWYPYFKHKSGLFGIHVDNSSIYIEDIGFVLTRHL